MCHVGVIMKVLPNVLFLYIACSDIHTVAIKNILGAMNIFCENGKKKKNAGWDWQLFFYVVTLVGKELMKDRPT